ncbi:MAG: VCBS repeat-containing protein [Acidobacteria bacterium]|nr:VCBS repeat-containing protein [Acidobacteriota bacterium]MCI0725102.1 VCBS repeat-containing protein [Acidobacteriota bacterium]
MLRRSLHLVSAICWLCFTASTASSQASFDFVPNTAPWQAAGGLATGELNGDGFTDVVGTSLFPTQIYIGFGDGRGRFRFGSALDYQASRVSLSDFNQDGKLDLAATTLSGLRVFVGDGRGGFVLSDSYSYFWGGPSPIVARDMNGDGKTDLVIGLRGFSLFRGDGTGRFQGLGDFQTSQDRETSDLVVFDFDQDGRVDVAHLDVEAGRIVVSRQVASGGFSPSATLSGSLRSKGSLVLGDFNRDGNLDLAANGPAAVTVFLGNGNGTFSSGTRFTTPNLDPSAVSSLAAAHIDSGGNLDLILTGTALNLPADQATEAFFGDGRGGFRRELMAGVGGQYIRAADVDGNAAVDFAIASAHRSLAVIVPGSRGKPKCALWMRRVVRGDRQLSENLYPANMGRYPVACHLVRRGELRLVVKHASASASRSNW